LTKNKEILINGFYFIDIWFFYSKIKIKSKTEQNKWYKCIIGLLSRIFSKLLNQVIIKLEKQEFYLIADKYIYKRIRIILQTFKFIALIKQGLKNFENYRLKIIKIISKNHIKNGRISPKN